MKLNELITDDDAVSPVIGVILMVAITVILAAVIGTFVLGLGDQVQSTTPQAQFTFDEGSGSQPAIDITHDGGDSVNVDNLNVTSSEGAIGANTCQDATGNTEAWDSSEISAGDQCTIPSSTLSTDGELRIIWESDDGSNSGTLADYDYDHS
jgi:flagellin-like protein